MSLLPVAVQQEVTEQKMSLMKIKAVLDHLLLE